MTDLGRLQGGCDTDSGLCLPEGGVAIPCSAASDCDDSDPCTADECTEGICAYEPQMCECRRNSDCDDSDACTEDRCENGVCDNTRVCECSEPADCDDGDDCTADQCEEGLCSYSEVCECESDAECDDNDPCTADTCAARVCISTRDPACECGSALDCAGSDNLCFTTDCRENRCVIDVNPDCEVSCARSCNLLSSCDFSTGLADWDPFTFGDGAATFSVVDQRLTVDVLNSGFANWHVAPRQLPLTLVGGEEYILRFEASADPPRTVEVSVTQEGGSYVSYSGIRLIDLTPELRPYAIQFVQSVDEFSAKVEFLLGGRGQGEFVLDNVYLGAPEGCPDDVTPDAGSTSDAGIVEDAGSTLVDASLDGG